MLCALYHDIKRTTSMLLLCDHLTHALHISCLLDAARNFSNDFPHVRTVYYTTVPSYTSLIMFYFHWMHHFYDVNVRVCTRSAPPTRTHAARSVNIVINPANP
jgi:hypothetical protein